MVVEMSCGINAISCATSKSSTRNRANRRGHAVVPSEVQAPNEAASRICTHVRHAEAWGRKGFRRPKGSCVTHAGARASLRSSIRVLYATCLVSKTQQYFDDISSSRGGPSGAQRIPISIRTTSHTLHMHSEPEDTWPSASNLLCPLCTFTYGPQSWPNPERTVGACSMEVGELWNLVHPLLSQSHVCASITPKHPSWPYERTKPRPESAIGKQSDQAGMCKYRRKLVASPHLLISSGAGLGLVRAEKEVRRNPHRLR